MKKLTYITAVLMTLVILTSTTFAGGPANAKAKIKMKLVEQNYLAGLDSDNLGLKLSSAYWLGELKSEDAVIPLMRVLHFSDNENHRILAALSLSKIGSEKSLFALKRAAKFDSDQRVRKMCANFYNNQMKAN